MTIPHLRWVIAGLLLLATMVNYLDRNCFGFVIASDQFRRDFRMDDQQVGYVVATFGYVYAIMQALGGRLIDRIGTRRGFTVAVTFWSLANIMHAWAGDLHRALGSALGLPLTMANVWISFALFRGLLAVGEAGNFPGAVKTISEWFPPRERTVATGIFNMGSSIGATLVPVVVAGLILRAGWQSAFVVTGAVGLVWVAVWLLLYRSPETHPWISPAERRYIRDGIDRAEKLSADTGGSVWGSLLRSPAFWGIAIARVMSEPAWQFASNWIPKYFRNRGVADLQSLAYFGLATFLASDLGSVVGGLVPPALQRRGLSLMNARRAAVTLGAVLMLSVTCIVWTESRYVALALLSVGTFAHQGIAATLHTLPADAFPSRMVATANGLSGCCAYLGGGTFMLLVGALFKRGLYSPLFIMMGTFDLAGAAALWWLIPCRKGTANGAKQSPSDGRKTSGSVTT